MIWESPTMEKRQCQVSWGISGKDSETRLILTVSPKIIILQRESMTQLILALCQFSENKQNSINCRKICMNNVSIFIVKFVEF